MVAGSWEGWLLDSGAATSVLSQNYESMYRCQAQKDSAEHWKSTGASSHKGQCCGKFGISGWTGASGKKKTQWGCVTQHYFDNSVGQEGFSHLERRTFTTRTVERSLVTCCCGEGLRGQSSTTELEELAVRSSQRV